MKAGAYLEASTAEGFAPLHLAALKGHLEVVTTLFKAGGDLHALDSDGFALLHMAVIEGHLEVLTMLVRPGQTSIQ